MVDISMCSNKDCSLSAKCYRFMAIPSDWQSFNVFEPVKKMSGWSCGNFWPIEGRRISSGAAKVLDGHSELETGNSRYGLPVAI